ncbi:hypothetical protein T484DRAFT_1932476 [Baffinella frigidus]|nr:hypothetical protein T484DRAFT_1932476 [Cryptophyta sp. CCMP2293]
MYPSLGPPSGAGLSATKPSPATPPCVPHPAGLRPEGITATKPGPATPPCVPHQRRSSK